MNMMAVSCGETTIVIDAGVMFPGPDLLGVDLIVPDLTYLQDRHVAALVLTHGHEDHIGGVPLPMPLRRRPGLRHAADARAGRAQARAARDRPGAASIRWRPRERVQVGPFTIEFLRVTHSMPDCVALAIHTPAGTLVHTGDFKIDQTPLDGEHFDLQRLRDARHRGRARAVCRQHQRRPAAASPARNSTSSTPSRRSSRSAAGKIVVAMFASSLYRMQILVRPRRAVRPQGRVRRPRHD